MSKTIKFNLILNGNRVRNLDGLRENFSVEDILEYFDNGILEKWLKIREYEEEYEAVSSIDKSSDIKEKIKAFVEIFAIDADERDIDEAVYVLNYMTRNNQKNSDIAENSNRRNTIISEYFKQYNEIIGHMETNKNDWEKLKADAAIVEMDFVDAFYNDMQTMAKKYCKDAPLVLTALLSRPKLNAYFQANPIQKEYLPDRAFCVKKVSEKMFNRITLGAENVLLQNVLIASTFNCKLNGISNGQSIEKDGENTEWTVFESVSVIPNGNPAYIYYLEY